MRVRVLILFAIAVIAVRAEKEIIIDLHKQKAYALEDDEVVFSGRVSTGKRGHRTPTGYYRVLDKELKHISNRWPKPNGGAKMPYMLRLTNSGIAMHLGYTPRYPASHGCIRMKNGFAQKMYKWAPIGTPVTIEEDSYIEDTFAYHEPEPGKHKRSGRKSKNRHYSDDGYEIIELYDD